MAGEGQPSTSRDAASKTERTKEHGDGGGKTRPDDWGRVKCRAEPRCVRGGLAAKLAPPPACAASNDRAHHLVALWPVACRADLRRVLSAPGRRGIGRFAAGIGMRRVDFAVAKWDPFLNVNT